MGRETVRQDFASDCILIAKLYKNGYLMSDQLKDMDALLGLPPQPKPKLTREQMEKILGTGSSILQNGTLISSIDTASASLANMTEAHKKLTEAIEKTKAQIQAFDNTFPDNPLVQWIKKPDE